MAHQNAPLLIVISGPSGVGKDTVIQMMKLRDLPFHFVVTATSRPPRPEERDGVDYHFVSEAEFERMIANDELVEYAWVYDQYKGVPRAEIEDALASGVDVVMRLDVQGAATIQKKYPEAVLIFLNTQTEGELIRRLQSRKTESSEELDLRQDLAKQELEQMDEFDYVVLNPDSQVAQAVDDILAIMRAEHLRTHPHQAAS